MIVTLALLAGCRADDPMDAFQPGERGRVVRIIDGDALVLDTGQSVRLIGIEAPAKARRDREAETFATESARMLEDMALGREVRLYYAGLTRDRYDRALAHVATIDDLGPPFWLNVEMAKRGGARVRLYPDTAIGSTPLIEAEAEAREAASGLWGETRYKVLRASELPEDTARFQIVTGIIGKAREADDVACKRPLLSSWLALEIEPMAEDICALPEGTRVEARGYIWSGSMEITHAL
ncbi:MAG: thermonuclease family protein, partial [Pseudomonadota bacterium]